MASSTTTTTTIADKSFKGLADLVKHLPTGTIFIFQFLSPLLTNKGKCHVANKYLASALLLFCGLSCSFSTFTDSYTASDNKVYYGFATMKGMWTFTSPESGDSSTDDLSKYKLRFADFVHGLLSVLVFAVVALLDTNTVTCFYPSFGLDEKAVIMTLPAVIGSVASFVFVLYPNTRHGIGYAATMTKGTESSSDTAGAQVTPSPV